MVFHYCHRRLSTECYTSIPLQGSSIPVYLQKELENVHDTRSLERRQETTNHSRKSNSGDDFSTRGSESAKHTNLDTKRSKIRETTKTVRSNSICARAQRCSTLCDGLKIEVSGELVGDKFCSQELGNTQNFCARNTKQEGDRVEDVPNDKFKCQMMNAKPSSNPSQETVDTSNSQVSRGTAFREDTLTLQRVPTRSTRWSSSLLNICSFPHKETLTESDQRRRGQRQHPG